MNTAEYVVTIKERLLLDPCVRDFHIVRERVTATDGHLRVRVVFSDGGTLEFSEYFQYTPEGSIQVVTYSYHWADIENNLIIRWDNTPHFPNLPGFPHHFHEGKTGTVHSSRSMNIFAVLDEIAQR
jgi:hypothetical protein